MVGDGPEFVAPRQRNPSATQPHVHRQPWEGVCLLKCNNILLMERYKCCHVGLTQAQRVSLKLDYFELKPGQALLEGGWIKRNRVWLVCISLSAGTGPAARATVWTVLMFLPAISLFRKGMRCSRIWWMLPIVHSFLEATYTQVSAQWRMNNHLDYYLNNVGFIKQTCPGQEKQKVDF